MYIADVLGHCYNMDDENKRLIVRISSRGQVPNGGKPLIKPHKIYSLDTFSHFQQNPHNLHNPIHYRRRT